MTPSKFSVPPWWRFGLKQPPPYDPEIDPAPDDIKGEIDLRDDEPDEPSPGIPVKKYPLCQGIILKGLP